MAQIDRIVAYPDPNSKGSIVRGLLNSVIDWVNSFKTNVTENENDNASLGNGAGVSLTDGVENTFYGANSGAAQTSGNECTAIGANNQLSNKYGSRNTTYGASCMSTLINGNYSDAFGYQSQGFTVFGWRNTSGGYKSMRGLQVGRDNVGLGYKVWQNMNSTNKGIGSYTDVGGGQIECNSGSHGRSEGETIDIVGTGSSEDHAWDENYDGQYVITNVTANTFEITAAYVDPVDLLSTGMWWKSNEAVGNVGIGPSVGLTHGKGSYNILIGYLVVAPNPDGNRQLNIGDTITGIMEGEKWTKIDGSFILKPGAVRSVAEEGEMYFNSADKHFYGYNGTDWVQLDN